MIKSCLKVVDHWTLIGYVSFALYAWIFALLVKDYVANEAIGDDDAYQAQGGPSSPNRGALADIEANRRPEGISRLSQMEGKLWEHLNLM